MIMMRRTFFSVAVLVLVSLSTPVHAMFGSDHSSNSLRDSFVQAMDQATARLEQRDHQAALVQRLLQHATPTHQARDLANNNNNQYYNGNYNNANYNNNYNYYNQYKNNGYYNNNNNNAQQQEEEDDDDTYDFDDAFDYGSLDLTEYALKYMGCQNIHTWSDHLAAMEDDGEEDDYRGTSDSGNLAMDRFVVFRLCPKESCSNYNQWGCSHNYGEYMIPMEDYLKLTNKYHRTKYQEYCNTCTKCMNNNNNNNAGGRRHLDNNKYGGGQYYNYNGNYQGSGYNYKNNQYNNRYNNNNYGGGNNNQYSNNYYQNNGNDDAVNNNANNDDGANNNNDDQAAAAANDDDAAAATDDATLSSTSSSSGHTCQYETACKDYQAACKHFDADDDTDYSDFFTCSQQAIGNSYSYLGPHCRSDGFTMGIGVYSDSGCNSYVQDLVDLQDSMSSSSSKSHSTSSNKNYLEDFSPKQCISCNLTESYDLTGNDGMYPVCGYLYQKSAKCNRYLGKSDTYEGAYQQEANEEDVCNFVSSLVENNYNEYGEIILENQELSLSNWKSLNAYRMDVYKVSSGQILGILFSVGLVVLLSGYVAYLRYKLQHRAPWIAGRHKSGYPGAAAVSRINSGITMQRSISGLEPSMSGGSMA